MDPARPFRLIALSSMFTDVNETDARASMKAWLETVAGEHGIRMNLDPVIYRTVAQVTAVDKQAPVDAVLLTLPEYAELNPMIPFSLVSLGVVNGKITEEYVLLVRKDKMWKKAAQLSGKDLNVLDNPRMSLALIWLDTLLLEQGLAPVGQWFGSVNRVSDVAQAVLPVFFGKKDACVTTRDSFALMGELNPQVVEQLMILACSGSLIPSVNAFRKEPVSPFRSRVLNQLEQLAESPAGRQILTLVRSERIETHPVSILDSSLALLSRHRLLCMNTPSCFHPTGRENRRKAEK